MEFDELIMSVDAAFKDNDDNDYVAIEVWGKKKAAMYLVDVVNEHLNFPDTLRKIRFVRAIYDDITRILIEAYFVDGNGEFHIFLISDHPALHNARFNVVLGNFHDSFVPLNSPITELRIDKEWFNDEQIKVVYLSTQPFADYKETALTSTDIRDIIDGVNVNLLPNPDGRLYLNHWTDFPLNNGVPDDTKFTNLHNDPFIGTGFLWKGGAAQTAKEIFSEFIAVKNDDYTLVRGKVDSIAGTVGDFGIGVSFYKSALATDKIGNTEYVYAEPGTALRYYALKLVTPLEATHVRVSMFIGPDVVSNRITWSVS